LCRIADDDALRAKLALNAAADLALVEALAYAQECQRAVRANHAGSYSERFKAT
jgi:hypothetical protein